MDDHIVKFYQFLTTVDILHNEFSLLIQELIYLSMLMGAIVIGYKGVT